MNSTDTKPGEATCSPSNGHEAEKNDDPEYPDALERCRESSVVQSENRKVKKRRRFPPWAFKMLNLFKDITIMVLVAITYAALSNDPPKITKGPPAYPFFPRDSPVIDWYRGQVSEAIEAGRTSDVSFVMFYAPWSAEAQSARKEFDLAARYMKEEVFFAAVNCWQPGTECRTQYGKVLSWPVLIAYTSYGRGIQYNGPIKTAHIVAFLRNVCWPFVRTIGRPLPATVSVYAEVDTSPGSYEYSVVYAMALRLLEKDPFREVPFYIASKSYRNNPELALVNWNETLFYPNDNGWSTENILAWVLGNMVRVNQWVSPKNTKSRMLFSHVKSGPTLILFTPRNPMSPNNDYYLMLTAIGNEYFQCENYYGFHGMKNATDVMIHTMRLRNYLNYNDLKQRCIRKAVRKRGTRNPLPDIVPNVWTNISCIVSKNKIKEDCVEEDDIKIGKCDFPGGDGGRDDANLFEYEDDFDEYADGYEPQARSRFTSRRFKTSMNTGENDRLSPKKLRKLSDLEECKYFLIGQDYQQSVFARTILEKNDGRDFGLSGLGCGTNYSLNFILMDSLLYYHFAEKLGINLFSRKDKSAVAIIDHKMETHFILDEEINDATVRRFVYNFTNGLLNRALKSSSDLKSNNTHVYIKRHCKKGAVCVEELDSKSFLPTVMSNNTAVVVMYYSRQCAFCNGIAYTYLTAAKKFSYVDNIIFTRIDGDLNVLPWEYTMYRFPTILFFPSVSKSESRMFPTDIPVTVQNLLGFVLSNVEPKLKIQSMWSICSHVKLQQDKSRCLSSTRLEMLSLIETTLRGWRSASTRRRQEILRKLQLLKHLHLLIAHDAHKVALVQAHFKKLASIRGDECRSRGAGERRRARDEL